MGKAMIHSAHRNGKVKAIAEVLAMIADAQPEFAPHRPRPVRETDEWLEESATEFCAALELFVVIAWYKAALFILRWLRLAHDFRAFRE
jgi:hypothetical protein